MAGITPLETVEKLSDAFKQGDAEAALALYEPAGTLVMEPEKIASGTEALRQAIEEFAELKPEITFDSHKLFEAGDIALLSARWQLIGTAPDGSNVHMEGESADVLRRTPDGKWLIAIDNPWGTAVLNQQLHDAK